MNITSHVTFDLQTCTFCSKQACVCCACPANDNVVELNALEKSKDKNRPLVVLQDLICIIEAVGFWSITPAGFNRLTSNLKCGGFSPRPRMSTKAQRRSLRKKGTLVEAYLQI